MSGELPNVLDFKVGTYWVWQSQDTLYTTCFAITPKCKVFFRAAHTNTVTLATASIVFTPSKKCYSNKRWIQIELDGTKQIDQEKFKFFKNLCSR